MDDQWKRLARVEVPAQDKDEGLGHIVPISTYNKAFASLIFLTMITVLMATVDLGRANAPIAIFIASIKGAMVALFFMHLYYEKPLIRAIAIIPFILLGVLMLGILLDEILKHADHAVPLFPDSTAEELGGLTKNPSEDLLQNDLSASSFPALASESDDDRR